MQQYIFSVYYYHDPMILIKVKANTRTKAYEKATIKAIRIKNDLDFIELDNVLKINNSHKKNN